MIAAVAASSASLDTALASAYPGVAGNITIVIGVDRSFRVQLVAETESAERDLERLFSAIEPELKLLKGAIPKA